MSALFSGWLVMTSCVFVFLLDDVISDDNVSGEWRSSTKPDAKEVMEKLEEWLKTNIKDPAKVTDSQIDLQSQNEKGKRFRFNIGIGVHLDSRPWSPQCKTMGYVSATADGTYNVVEPFPKCDEQPAEAGSTPVSTPAPVAKARHLTKSGSRRGRHSMGRKGSRVAN